MAPTRSELRLARNRAIYRRRRIVAGLLVLVVVGGIAGAVVALTHSSAPRPPAPPPRRLLTTVRPDVVPPCNVVASLRAATPAYAGPGARTSSAQMPPTLAGQPVAVPVIDQVGSWLQVRVQGHPNGVTAWLTTPSVQELADPYRIVVDLAHERLFLYRAAQIVIEAPAAIGAPATPTPLGNYFVTLLAQPPSSNYGPFVVVTSALAPNLTEWVEGSQPVIAITGPLQWQNAIGSANGAVTAGGVALRTSDLAKLRPVPLGTPVDVVTSWDPPAKPKHSASTAPTRRAAVVPAVAPFPMGLDCVVAPG